MLPIVLRGRRRLRAPRHAAVHRHAALLRERQRAPAGRLRGAVRHDAARADRAGRRRGARAHARAPCCMGGAAGTFVRPDELDLPLTLEDARAAGTTLGSGVVMVFDDTVDLRDVVRRIAAFFRDESCGQCVPCRVGTVRQEEALHRLAYGRPRGSVRRTSWRCSPRWAPGCATPRSAGSARRRTRPSSRPSTGCGCSASRAVAARRPRCRSARADIGRGAAPGRGRAHDRRRARRGRRPAPPSSTPAGRSGIEIPTLCYLETLAPVNACRLCVVEVEGARVLVPSCSRAVEPGMNVHTRSERVRALARRMVLEMLASSVDLSTAPGAAGALRRVRRARRALRAAVAARRPRPRRRRAPRAARRRSSAASVAQPVKVDNELYVRDYAKCVLCYSACEACGEDHQNTFAIGVAGRGFDARISTEANAAARRVGLRLLRQLRRRLPDRRADGEDRVRPARRGGVGRRRARP